MKKLKGFTLIELLVVIAIIGILAVVILSALSQARKAARDSKKAEAVRNAMTAIETYASVNDNVYPTSLALLSPSYLAAIPTEIGVTTLATDSYCVMSKPYEAKTGIFYAKNGVAALDTTSPLPTTCP